MLGKLIKHEWLSTWKVPTALCIYLAILTLLGCTSFLSPLWQSDNRIVETFAGSSIFLYVISLMATAFATFVYFVVRFYRNMYTDEGYLMHTLPVKSWEHIFSKGLVFFIWTLISGLAVILSVFSISFTAIAVVTEVDLAQIMSELRLFWPEIMQAFREAWGLSFGVTLLLVVISVICKSACSILLIYTAISIGQTFNKHKVMASFIAFGCLMVAIQIVTSLIQVPLVFLRINQLDFSSSVTVSSILSPSFWVDLILSVICITVFYLVTETIMRKKLNLD